jgi:hypothetical protein
MVSRGNRKLEAQTEVAPLDDPELLAAYRLALSENRRFSGYVTWKPRPQEWVFKNLPGYTPKAVSNLMHEFVESGGEIDQVRETREEWLDFKFHYDLRLPISDRVIYVETVLFSDDPENPQVGIVNIKYA